MTPAAPASKLLRRFMLRALAWLPLCFFLWWWVSGLVVYVPSLLASKTLTWFWPQLFTSVSAAIDPANGKPILAVLTSVMVTETGPDGRVATGLIEFAVYPLIYGYSLPLFFGLALATPLEEERRWGHMAVGALFIWLAQAFGLVADALKTMVMGAGGPAAAAASAAGLSPDLVGLCYQFGYLILPTVVPAALWLALNQSFIEALTGHKFGEPASGDAGRSRTS
jgi:hypothetical protein